MNNHCIVARRVGCVILISVAGALVAGCSKKPEAATPTGQVIAHVGKDDITAQELQNEFRWTQTPPDKQNDEATIKRVLSGVVLRKYLAERAVAAGLDREPTTLLDLLRAREQVLANAIVARDVSTKVAGIGRTEIDHYIASQPWKFANRQIFTVDQITIPPIPEAQAAVTVTKDLKSLDEIDQKLNELKVLHNRSMGVISSSQLPEQAVKQIQEKKDTDQFYVQTQNGGVFFKVKGEETRPLTGEDADRVARQALVADLVREEAGTQGLAASADAAVKYEGPYARIMGQQEPSKPAEGKPANGN
jgi:EpsD family peptidyl-prolyl cis-trans isomerase